MSLSHFFLSNKTPEHCTSKIDQPIRTNRNSLVHASPSLAAHWPTPATYTLTDQPCISNVFYTQMHNTSRFHTLDEGQIYSIRRTALRSSISSSPPRARRSLGEVVEVQWIPVKYKRNVACICRELERDIENVPEDRLYSARIVM